MWIRGVGPRPGWSGELCAGAPRLSPTDRRAAARWFVGWVVVAWVFGVGWARRVWLGGIAEVRGPAACLRRDALFRRLLLVADVVAIVGAFVLTVEFSRRSVGLTWVAAAGVPILVVCAKLTGLYDRDETLLRKTTLDEAPKLFQLATLCALVAWLTGGLITHVPLGSS